METRKKTIEYSFLRHNINPVSGQRSRLAIALFLGLLHLVFIVLYGFFVEYKLDDVENVSKRLSTLVSMNAMIFLGIGFLMSFLQRYAYSAVGFSFLIGSFVIEWALLVKSWLLLGFNKNQSGLISINIDNILEADFCALAVLISFAVIVGRVSVSQLVIMATFEVVAQCLNEQIGKNLFLAHDTGRSMFVHAFGAIFGLTVSKILHHREIETRKETSLYYSDIFSLMGCLFIWINWPSFNAINATGDGQLRAVVNTLLAMVSSCISTFMISIVVGEGRMNMFQIQAASFTGGIVVGSVCDLAIQPFGAMICGTIAGIFSTLSLEYITPMFKRLFLFDTCGVFSTFGVSGLIAGIISGISALFLEMGNKQFENTLNLTRIPEIVLNLTTASNATALHFDKITTNAAGFQFAALAVTIAIAIFSGLLTGLVMRIPIFEQIREDDEMCSDETNWFTPDDFAINLTELRIKSFEEQELTEKITPID